MNPSHGKHWSKLLREETRRAIIERRIGSPDGKLHFKNSDGRKAFMLIQDLINDVAKLTDSEEGVPLNFQSPDELIDSGWVID